LGAIAGAGILFIIASGKAGFSPASGFATNGFGDNSPGKYALLACLVILGAVLAGFFYTWMANDGKNEPDIVGDE